METRLIEYFVTVADELSVTRAAERLFVAQSTVSAGLHSLERELGAPLFARTTKSVELTTAGEQLVSTARGILNDVERLRGLATESTLGLRGRVRIGTFAAMEMFNLPRILSEFRADSPLVELQLVASLTGSTGLADDLAHGRLDIAFLAVPSADEFDIWHLASYEYVALLPDGHPLAGRAALSLAELAAEPWVDVLPGYGNRVQLEQVLFEHGITRHVVAEVADLPSVPSCVSAGLGVAVIPAAVDLSGSVVRPIKDALPRWTLNLATQRGAVGRPQVRALVDKVRERASR